MSFATPVDVVVVANGNCHDFSSIKAPVDSSSIL